MKLLKERDSLAVTAKKLSRDLAKVINMSISKEQNINFDNLSHFFGWTMEASIQNTVVIDLILSLEFRGKLFTSVILVI